MQQSRKLPVFLLGIGLFGLSFGLVSSPVHADHDQSSVRLFLGQKHLDDDWNSLDRQNQIGVIFDIKRDAWPVSIAIDLFGSGEDKNRRGAERGYTLEQHLGLRKTWSIEGRDIRPYLGGGLALVQAEYEVIGGSQDDDSAVGGWIGGGFTWSFSPRWSIGADVRYSDAEVSLFGEDLQGGGMHGGITLGYRW